MVQKPMMFVVLAFASLATLGEGTKAKDVRVATGKINKHKAAEAAVAESKKATPPEDDTEIALAQLRQAGGIADHSDGRTGGVGPNAAPSPGWARAKRAGLWAIGAALPVLVNTSLSGTPLSVALPHLAVAAWGGGLFGASLTPPLYENETENKLNRLKQSAGANLERFKSDLEQIKKIEGDAEANLERFKSDLEQITKIEGDLVAAQSQAEDKGDDAQQHLNTQDEAAKFQLKVLESLGAIAQSSVPEDSSNFFAIKEALSNFQEAVGDFKA